MAQSSRLRNVAARALLERPLSDFVDAWLVLNHLEQAGLVRCPRCLAVLSDATPAWRAGLVARCRGCGTRTGWRAATAFSGSKASPSQWLVLAWGRTTGLSPAALARQTGLTVTAIRRIFRNKLLPPRGDDHE